MMNFLKNIIKYLYNRIRFNNVYLSFSASISLDSKLYKAVSIFANSQISSSQVGSYTYISSNCVFQRTNIGPFSSIGSDVLCGLATHPLNFISTYPGFYTNESKGAFFFGTKHAFDDKKTVNIGADVWIGARAIILGGINIGHGAVIGAGSVVTKDVPPYAIVGGVPARIIRYRFEENTIKSLLESRWWEKSIPDLFLLSTVINNPEAIAVIFKEKKITNE